MLAAATNILIPFTFTLNMINQTHLPSVAFYLSPAVNACVWWTTTDYASLSELLWHANDWMKEKGKTDDSCPTNVWNLVAVLSAPYQSLISEVSLFLRIGFLMNSSISGS